ILAANSYSMANDFNYWIIKLDSSGEIIWEKKLGGSNFDIAESILQTTDGGYLISGVTYSNDGDVSINKGSSDYWIIKLKQDGELEWEKSFGGSEDDVAYSGIQIADGNYIIAGYSNSVDGDVATSSQPQNAWVLKLNQEGELIW